MEPLFTTLDAPRTLVKTFLKSDSAKLQPIVGTTHLAPRFVLGSVNRGDLWNQRRALLAYWGTADKPSYLHLRLLHDGYDFSAAQFFSAQREGSVLAGVNFAVDGGACPAVEAAIRAGRLEMRWDGLELALPVKAAALQSGFAAQQR